MNKELIKKYKAEFDHWLNGGELLYAYIDDTFSWKNMNAIDKNIYPVYARNPFQISEYHIIIINDEYVEFRKALAEGKTVQYNFGNHGINKKDFPNTWKDLDLSIGILADRACPENYRIKPEEPKFKVGDWVRDLRDNRIFQINSENFNLNLSITNGVYVHWQPKIGEWCWFWNKGTTITVLTLLEIVNDGNRKYFAAMPDSGGYYQYCEPFLGTLPTKLQLGN